MTMGARTGAGYSAGMDRMLVVLLVPDEGRVVAYRYGVAGG